MRLPPLLRAAEMEGLTILWIPLSSSAYKRTKIAEYQAAHPPKQARLKGLRPAKRDEAWVKICEMIDVAMNS